jgi:hypothetical protein
MQVSFEIPEKSLELITKRKAYIEATEAHIAALKNAGNVSYDQIAKLRKTQDKALKEIGAELALAFALADKTRAN